MLTIGVFIDTFYMDKKLKAHEEILELRASKEKLSC